MKELRKEYQKYVTHDGEQKRIAKYKSSPGTQANTIRASAGQRMFPKEDMDELNRVLPKWISRGQETPVHTLWDLFLKERRDAIETVYNRKKEAAKPVERKTDAEIEVQSIKKDLKDVEATLFPGDTKGTPASEAIQSLERLKENKDRKLDGAILETAENILNDALKQRASLQRNRKYLEKVVEVDQKISLDDVKRSVTTKRVALKVTPEVGALRYLYGVESELDTFIAGLEEESTNVRTRVMDTTIEEIRKLNANDGTDLKILTDYDLYSMYNNIREKYQIWRNTCYEKKTLKDGKTDLRYTLNKFPESERARLHGEFKEVIPTFTKLAKSVAAERRRRESIARP